MSSLFRRKPAAEDAAASSSAEVQLPSYTEEKDQSLDQSNSKSAYIKLLKDYSLLMEYKKMKQQAPAGVYVLPSADSLRRWYGVIFIRKGHYRGGIFKFCILIPTSYPDEGPRVHFLQHENMFHPLIQPETGLLDLSIQFPVWTSSQHYLVLVLYYIKKIFYKTDFWEPRKGVEAFNPKAQQLWIRNKEEYLQRCSACCATSVNTVYEKCDDRNSIIFERPRPAHEEAIKRIIQQAEVPLPAGYIDWFRDGVQKLDDGPGPAPTSFPPITINSSASSTTAAPRK